MMPNTSVNPAASRNSSNPNCNPFKNCSTTRSMGNLYQAEIEPGRKKTAAARERRRRSSNIRRSLHRAFVVEAVLVVLDDGSDSLQREFAVGVLHHVLQIEILDRDVVIAVFERAAQRFEIRLLHLGLHLVLLAGVALHRDHG